MKTDLDIDTLIQQAAIFAEIENSYDEPSLYGVTDGKRIGTYIEHKFKLYLSAQYIYEEGNSASGIDFPGLGIDLKVTSITQPQSSSPFKSTRQQIYGLGYHLLIFVYEKFDDHHRQTAWLYVKQAYFIPKEHTADYQTTRRIIEIVTRDGNDDDLVAFLQDHYLIVEDIAAREIANEILRNPPPLGYITAKSYQRQPNFVITL